MYFYRLLFEKAYCEYRLNRLDESLKTLKSIVDPSNREKELLAQVVCIVLLMLFCHCKRFCKTLVFHMVFKTFLKL